MQTIRRILSRGWLGNAISVLTFGYYPNESTIVPVDYIVDGTVCIRFAAAGDVCVRFAGAGDAEMRFVTDAVGVEL